MLTLPFISFVRYFLYLLFSLFFAFPNLFPSKCTLNHFFFLGREGLMLSFIA